MKVRITTVAVIVVSLFLATFFSGQYLGHSRADNVAKVNTDSLVKVISLYDMEVNDANLYIKDKEQEILLLNQKIDLALIGKEYCRKLYLKALDEITYQQAQIDVLIDSINHISIPCENFDDVDGFNIVIKESY